MTSLLVLGDLDRAGDLQQDVELWRTDFLGWDVTHRFLGEVWCVPRRYVVIDAGRVLSGGAQIVSGNEPFALNSKSDTRSLRLAAGASATSPLFCVDLNYPTFRLPVRSLDRQGQADLVVEVRYPQGADRSWKGVRTETGKAENGWRITNDIDMKPDTHSGTPGARQAQIRFTVKATPGMPGWQLDSVFVDPRMH